MKSDIKYKAAPLYTKIKAKKDLYNGGKCFTKGEIYDLSNPIHVFHVLMNTSAINDMGERHTIGLWYRHFSLIKK